MSRQPVGELDYSLVQLNNLGQLDVSFALPLPTLHAPPPSAGVDEAGQPAELPPAAVLDAVAAALAAADVSYVCVPAPHAALRRQRPPQLQRTQPYLPLTPPRRRSFPTHPLPLQAPVGGSALRAAVLQRNAAAFDVTGAFRRRGNSRHRRPRL